MGAFTGLGLRWSNEFLPHSEIDFPQILTLQFIDEVETVGI